MEFPRLIPLKEIFTSEISIVDKDLVPYGSPAVKKYGEKAVRESVTEILNRFGAASAAAQELNTVITSAQNLESSNGSQVIYLLCDLGKNQVVGLLKMGKKHLFLFDQFGSIHELNPLCVLDFYVHESYQRRGYGKALFDAMLKEEGVDIRHLAIDLPSDNMIYFLRKHYKLDYLIPQVNHFAVYDGFFNSRVDIESGKKRWHGLDQAPEKPQKLNKTILQDSRSYNKDVAIHFRNMTHGRFASKTKNHGNGTIVGDQPDSSFY